MDIDDIIEVDQSDTDILTEAKVKFVEKFLSNKLQKTEITQIERYNIPALLLIAKNPLPRSKRDSKPGIIKEWGIPELDKFIGIYLDFGIPVNRKGRKEEVKVLCSMLKTDNQEIEDSNIPNILK